MHSTLNNLDCSESQCQSHGSLFSNDKSSSGSSNIGMELSEDALVLSSLIHALKDMRKFKKQPKDDEEYTRTVEYFLWSLDLPTNLKEKFTRLLSLNHRKVKLFKGMKRKENILFLLKHRPMSRNGKIKDGPIGRDVEHFLEFVGTEPNPSKRIHFTHVKRNHTVVNNKRYYCTFRFPSKCKSKYIDIILFVCLFQYRTNRICIDPNLCKAHVIHYYSGSQVDLWNRFLDWKGFDKRLISKENKPPISKSHFCKMIQRLKWIQKPPTVRKIQMCIMCNLYFFKIVLIYIDFL